MVERVGDEIEDDLRDAVRVGLAASGGEVEDERNAAFVGEGLEECRGFACDFGEIAIGNFRHDRVGVVGGEFEE